MGKEPTKEDKMTSYTATRNAKGEVTVTNNETGAIVCGTVQQTVFRGSRAAKAAYVVIDRITPVEGSRYHEVYGGTFELVVSLNPTLNSTRSRVSHCDYQANFGGYEHETHVVPVTEQAA